MGGKRILIIESSNPELHLLKTVISKVLPEAEIAIAKSGLKALDLIKAQPNFDLIITNLSLPEIDGLEVIKRYRDLGGQAKVIAFTARSSYKNGLPKELFDKVILKPFWRWKDVLKEMGFKVT